MDSATLLVVVTTDLHEHPLYGLFLSLVILSLDILDVHLIYPEAVDPLAGPLNHGSLFHQELVSLIPVLALVHIYIHPHALLLKPELVAAGRQGAQMDVVDTLLVPIVLHKLG